MALAQIQAGSCLQCWVPRADGVSGAGSHRPAGSLRRSSHASYSEMLPGVEVAGVTPESLSPKRGSQKNKSHFNKRGIL